MVSCLPGPARFFILYTAKVTEYWILPSSRLLLGVSWFKIDFLGLIIGPIFKGRAAQEED
jgi:hypothetical protein